MNRYESSLPGIKYVGTLAKCTGILYVPGPGTPESLNLALLSFANEIPLSERLCWSYAPGPGTILLVDRSSCTLGPVPI